MKVTEKDVLYVADLANLELTPAERDRMVRDLNSILDYIDRLNELDTRDVPPMTQTAAGCAAGPAGTRVLPALRQDVVTSPHAAPPAAPDPYSRSKRSLTNEDAVRNAPDAEGAFFKVPKVIER